MHIPTSLIAALATAFVTMVSAQASTGLPTLSIDFSSLLPSTTYPASVKSSYLSELAAKASSQVTNTAFQAEITNIPEASGRDLVSDITKAAAEALWSGTHTSPLPAWLTALPSTGYAVAVINADVNDIFQSEVADSTSKITAKGSSLSSKVSSLTSSLSSKLSSVESKISASATKTSTGGAAAAHATGIMAMGAVMAGGVGIMVGAAGF